MIEHNIPESVLKALENLSFEDADKFWMWLDGEPDAIYHLINLLHKNHPDLLTQI